MHFALIPADSFSPLLQQTFHTISPGQTYAGVQEYDDLLPYRAPSISHSHTYHV